MCTLTVPTCTHPLGNTRSPRKITPEVIWIPSTMTVLQSFILVIRDLSSHSCEHGTNSKLGVTKYTVINICISSRPKCIFAPPPLPPPPRPKKIRKLLFSNAPTAYSYAHLKTVVFAKLGVYRAQRGYCSLPSRRFKGSRISFLTTGGRKITLT